MKHIGNKIFKKGKVIINFPPPPPMYSRGFDLNPIGLDIRMNSLESSDLFVK